MIKRELQILGTAIMFYTRIPMPKSFGFSDENLNKATRYFPLIGLIAGGCGSFVFLLANQILSVQIAVVFGMASVILLTGAFHEDAFADFCDGFGGGYSKEQILNIMKDSRIGTYGAVGLILLILTKFVLLTDFSPDRIPLIFITAHMLSRLNPVLFIYTSQYVRQEKTGKSTAVGLKKSAATLVIAIISGWLPLVLFPLWTAPVFIITQALIFLSFRFFVHKKTGGYTGDILGALQQLSEIGFYFILLITNTMAGIYFPELQL